MYKDLKEKFAFTLGATHVGISHNIGGTLHRFVESFTHVGIFHITRRVAFTLAEGATHVGIFNNTRRVGFTLAEVLITLGIIGIVSAMTIPTLINNYQEKALNTQFINAHSFLSQALQLTKSEYNYDTQCYYPVNYSSGSQQKWRGCKDFYNSFFENLKVNKYCSKKAYENGCIPDYDGLDTINEKAYQDLPAPEGYNSYGEYITKMSCPDWTKNKIHNSTPTYVLNNGIIIFMYNTGQPMMAVDINGFSKPNEWGKDLFEFTITLKNNDLRFGSRSACQVGGKHPTIEKLQELGLK